MTFVKGQVANPKGRPKGSGKVQKMGLSDLIQKAMLETYGMENYDPVVELARIANDSTNPVDLRATCHDKVAKYVRPVLKAVEVSGTVDVDHTTRFDATDKLLAALEAMASAKKSGSPPVLDHTPVQRISDIKRHEGPEAPAFAPCAVVLDVVAEAVLEDAGSDEEDD